MGVLRDLIKDLGSSDAYSAFRSENFRRFTFARILIVLAGQIFFVTVGWHIYAITGKLLDLGLIGLASFLPFFVLTPFGGQVADTLNRQRVIIITQSSAFLVLLALALVCLSSDLKVLGTWPIYSAVVLIGAVRAFSAPSISSILPALVPIEHFSNAVSWNSSAWQLATVIGPALGGFLCAILPEVGLVYLTAGVFSLFGIWHFVSLKLERVERPESPRNLETFLAGFRFVKRNRILFGAVALDLFAVLFGGCVALLPAFVSDVLHLGPTALGILRASPSVGAVLMAIWVAHHPLGERAGKIMFVAILVFSLATIGFGLSSKLLVSSICLVIVGASDMLSVIVRQNLVQLATPDEMRGRVNAVSQIFIGTSNELGEFESGMTAAWFGLVPAIVFGGLASCLIVLVWSRLYPELLDFDLNALRNKVGGSS